LNKPRRHQSHAADANHYQIIRECTKWLLVEDIHNGGLADIIVCCRGQIYIFEIKAPGKRKNLTAKQKEKRMLWDRYIYVVESSQEILKIVGLI
jgi:hypothetical protein